MTNPTDGPHTTTTSPKTNHAEKARELLDAVHDWQEREGETDATMIATVLEAQAIASLALVEEQRTASLIALWGALRNPPAGIRPTTAQWERIARLDDLLAARLDLTQDVTP